MHPSKDKGELKHKPNNASSYYDDGNPSSTTGGSSGRKKRKQRPSFLGKTVLTPGSKTLSATNILRPISPSKQATQSRAEDAIVAEEHSSENKQSMPERSMEEGDSGSRFSSNGKSEDGPLNKRFSLATPGELKKLMKTFKGVLNVEQWKKQKMQEVLFELTDDERKKIAIRFTEDEGRIILMLSLEEAKGVLNLLTSEEAKNVLKLKIEEIRAVLKEKRNEISREFSGQEGVGELASPRHIQVIKQLEMENKKLGAENKELKAKIASLQKTDTPSNNEVLQLSNDEMIRLLKASNADLETCNGKLNADIKKLERELKQLKEAKGNLEWDHEGTEGANLGFKKRIEALTEENKVLKTHNKAFKNQIKELEEGKLNLEKLVAEGELKLKKLVEAFEKQNKELEEGEKQLAECNSELEKNLRLIEELRKHNEGLETIKIELNQQIELLSAEKRGNEELEYSDTTNLSLFEEMSNVEENSSVVNNKYGTAHSLHEFNGSAELQRPKLEFAGKSGKEIEDYLIKCLLKVVENAEEMIQKIDKQISNSAIAIQDSRGGNDESTANNVLSESKGNSQEQEGVISASEKAINALKTEKEDVVGQIEILDMRLKAVIYRIHKNILNEKALDRVTLDGMVNGMLSKNMDLLAQVAANAENAIKISDLQRTLQEAQAEIERLTEVLGRKESEFGELEKIYDENLKKLTAELKAVQAKVKKLEQELALEKAFGSNLQEKIKAENEVKIKALEAEIDQYKQLVEKLFQAFNSIKNANATLKAKLKEAAAQLLNEQSKIKDSSVFIIKFEVYKNAYAGLGKWIKKILSFLDGIKKNPKAIEDKLPQLGQITGNINELLQGVEKNIQKDISKELETLEEAKKAQAEIIRKRDQALADLEKLKQKNQGLEEMVGRLENEVDSLGQQLQQLEQAKALLELQIQEQSDEIERLNQVLANPGQTEGNVQEDLDAVRRAEEERKKTLEELDKARAELAKLLAEAVGNSDTIDDLVRRIQGVEKQKKVLEAIISTFEAQKAELEDNQMKEMQALITQHQQQVQQLEVKASKLEEQLKQKTADYGVALQWRQTDLGQLQAQKAEIESIRTQLQEVQGELEETKTQLKEALKAKEAAEEADRKNRKVQAEEKSQVEQALQALQQQISELVNERVNGVAPGVLPVVQGNQAQSDEIERLMKLLDAKDVELNLTKTKLSTTETERDEFKKKYSWLLMCVRIVLTMIAVMFTLAIMDRSEGMQILEGM